MKKLLILISAFLLSFLLIGCNEKEDENDKAEETKENVEDKTPTEELEPEKEDDVEEELIDYSHAIFASANGTGDGTKDNPTSIRQGLAGLSSVKNTLYLYGGDYNLDSSIILSGSGISSNYYSILAFKDEKVVLDFGRDYRKNPTITGGYLSENNKGIVLKGSYYKIKGLTITNCGSLGMQIRGNYNIIENCVFAYNGNTGCNISSSNTSTIENRAHDNLIKNCTSYGNYDWDRTDGEQGEDADGFSSNMTSGINNVFDGCISYNNSDDGWDLFTKHKTGKIGSVTIKNCIAFSNGYAIDGSELKNGNGFKLGGRALEVDHYVENCIAFNNKANGFDDNSNPGTISLKNCTAYKNGDRNYGMGRFLEETNTYTSTWYEGDTLYGPIENVPKSHNVFENCLSYNGRITDSFCGTAKNCYFYNSSNKYYYFNALAVCNSKYNIGEVYNSYNPFESLNIDISDLDSIHYNFRNSDYSINLKSFLKIRYDFISGASLHD